MDEFARLKSDARAPYFETAATGSGLSLQVIEKDFWVCWTLKRLFALPKYGESLIFKGGTSLSKVFSVIERFSEDIDISIDKGILGFAEKKDPEKAPSSKKQQQLIEELAVACQTLVKEPMLEAMRKDLGESLGMKKGWALELDSKDPDQQTLLFGYPTAGGQGETYIRASVKIELGARSDHWPSHRHTIRPYLDQYVPKTLKDPLAQVKVLDAARTFWEKATILHMYAHLPEGKTIAPAQSRHYYDFYCLLKSKHRDEAIGRRRRNKNFNRRLELRLGKCFDNRQFF